MDHHVGTFSGVVVVVSFIPLFFSGSFLAGEARRCYAAAAAGAHCTPTPGRGQQATAAVLRIMPIPARHGSFPGPRHWHCCGRLPSLSLSLSRVLAGAEVGTPTWRLLTSSHRPRPRQVTPPDVHLSLVPAPWAPRLFPIDDI